MMGWRSLVASTQAELEDGLNMVRHTSILVAVDEAPIMMGSPSHLAKKLNPYDDDRKLQEDTQGTGSLVGPWMPPLSLPPSLLPADWKGVMILTDNPKVGPPRETSSLFPLPALDLSLPLSLPLCSPLSLRMSRRGFL